MPDIDKAFPRHLSACGKYKLNKKVSRVGEFAPMSFDTGLSNQLQGTIN
jgi:hypothetical protein